ncbi:GNAT family N-acetyltransferase [Rhodanobacter sp. Root561]|uniref:GNAT family N-acetyltransferase n=1 Tax=Rhodanobacter sp. Root561 TaxID=1736560 RepID=UPI0009E99EEF|nr:GNAT family N-acetyltransferase [Rhodanobacter sp. Root561]
MERRDVYQQVARLHVDNINQGFLATLGTGFVSLMYQAIDEAPASVLLVEEREGRIIGFVAGGCGMGAIYKRMLRSPVRLGLALLPSLMRPARALRILEILRYSRGHSLPSHLPEAELLSIAVDASCRGQKIAERLYRRLEEYFRNVGVTSFRIIVGEVLAPAHRFYLRMGAVATDKVEVHEGELSVVYVQELTHARPTST